MKMRRRLSIQASAQGPIHRERPIPRHTITPIDSTGVVAHPPGDVPFTRWLVASAIIFYVVHALRHALIPFVIAGGLAYVSGPLVRWVQHQLKSTRWLAALLVYLVWLAAAVGLGLLAVHIALPQIAQAAACLPESLHLIVEHIFQGNEINNVWTSAYRPSSYGRSAGQGEAARAGSRRHPGDNRSGLGRDHGIGADDRSTRVFPDRRAAAHPRNALARTATASLARPEVGNPGHSGHWTISPRDDADHAVRDRPHLGRHGSGASPARSDCFWPSSWDCWN